MTQENWSGRPPSLLGWLAGRVQAEPPPAPGCIEITSATQLIAEMWSSSLKRRSTSAWWGWCTDAGARGKTMLLERLCEAYGGFYWQAEETEAGENLASLSEAYSKWANGPGPIRFQNWNEAFVALTSQRSTPTPIVIDEIGRVIAKAPAVPSQIQRAMSPTGPASRDHRSRLILCGSAFGEMRRLIDGTAPLRGRASLELVVQPFDFRTAADFWRLSANPDAAFEMY